MSGWLTILYLLYCCFFSPLFPTVRSGSYDVTLRRADTERVCVVDENDEALLWRLRMIEDAQSSIDLATWELADDETGRTVMAALADAAQRGVQVRLLIDGWKGQQELAHSDFFDALVSCDNVEVRFYNPVEVGNIHNVHYRMHEKYLIADDTLYLLGGRNTGDTYLKNGTGDSDTFADRDILVYSTTPGGETSLAQLRQYFETVWEKSDVQRRRTQPDKQEGFVQQAQALLDEAAARYGARLAEYDLTAETVATNGVTLLFGEIDPLNKEPVLWKQLCTLMAGAQESIVFQTPQLMANSEMRDDLTALVQQVGDGSLELITNVVEKSVNISGADHDNQRDKIVETGAEVYECADDYPVHTKTILIDDALSIVGSFNLDPRSAYLDTELMVVVDSPELNAELRARAEALKTKSRLSLADGSFAYGEDYVAVQLPENTQKLYALLTRVLRYFEHLL